MPQADSKTTTPKRKPPRGAVTKAPKAYLPKALKKAAAIETFPSPIGDPQAYGLIVQGNCMSPLVKDGDRAICSPATKIEVGMIVAFHFKDGRLASLKRVLFPAPRPPHPQDEVVFAINVEMDNPPKQFSFHPEIVDKMHAVVGVMRDGQYIAIAPRRAA